MNFEYFRGMEVFICTGYGILSFGLPNQSTGGAAAGLDLTKNVCEVFGTTGYINTAYTYTPYRSEL